MVIGEVTLELRRTGEKATLVCQGRPIGVAVTITLEELEALAVALAHDAMAWRQDRTRMPVEYYTVLGVSRDASAEAIQQAYRTRAKQDHPDTSASDTTTAMQALNEAYAVLGDPQQRQQYDDLTFTKERP